MQKHSAYIMHQVRVLQRLLKIDTLWKRLSFNDCFAPSSSLPDNVVPKNSDCHSRTNLALNIEKGARGDAVFRKCPNNIAPDCISNLFWLQTVHAIRVYVWSLE